MLQSTASYFKALRELSTWVIPNHPASPTLQTCGGSIWSCVPTIGLVRLLHCHLYPTGNVLPRIRFTCIVMNRCGLNRRNAKQMLQQVLLPRSSPVHVSYTYINAFVVDLFFSSPPKYYKTELVQSTAARSFRRQRCMAWAPRSFRRVA